MSACIATQSTYLQPVFKKNGPGLYFEIYLPWNWTSMSSPCMLQVVRIGSFCFQARHCARQQNLVLDSVFTVCYSILSFTGVYVVLLLIDLVNDWLVRSSQKWPILMSSGTWSLNWLPTPLIWHFACYKLYYYYHHHRQSISTNIFLM